MGLKFNSWLEMYASVLKDDPGFFYVIKHPTEHDRSRFMDKAETLKFIKNNIGLKTPPHHEKI